MPIRLKIIDLTAKFVDFYRSAQGLDPEVRWNLWKKQFPFLAGTESSANMTKRMLDASWQRYPEVMSKITQGPGGLRPRPEKVLEQLARQLAVAEDVEVALGVFVGNFDRHAFLDSEQGMPQVYFPIEETDVEWSSRAMVHEFALALHRSLSGQQGSSNFSLAYAAITEGLATHLEESLFPGGYEWVYIASNPDWLKQCKRKDRQILEGIRPYLGQDDPKVLHRFTHGKGTTGQEREVDYVGWRVVRHLLAAGFTSAELARLPQAECVALVNRAISELLRLDREQI